MTAALLLGILAILVLALIAQFRGTLPSVAAILAGK